MSQIPRVSVVMPVYNAARHLPQAIESILDQTFREFEFIIVDDHSTDETADILSRYGQLDSRIRVIRNAQNMRVAHSLNRGCETARSELIARMDGDDISLPERFERQVAFLDAHPQVGVLGTQTVFIEKDGQFSRQAEWQKPTLHNDLVWCLLHSTPLCHPSVMMRTQCLREVGGYDPSYPNEDMKLWAEMAFITRLANLDDVLLYYRMPSIKHSQRFRYWTPHIQRVSRELAERLLGHAVDPRLIQIWFDFQLHEALGKDVTQAEAIQVCQTLEAIFRAMKEKGLFELEDIEDTERRLADRIQQIIYAAYPSVLAYFRPTH
jgi:glycosyltransferase involved in cell wall biosynthesis